MGFLLSAYLERGRKPESNDLLSNAKGLAAIQVERWFAVITEGAICRGSLTSVKELVQKIDADVQHYSRFGRPLRLDGYRRVDPAKIARLCLHISWTRRQGNSEQPLLLRQRVTEAYRSDQPNRFL